MASSDGSVKRFVLACPATMGTADVVEAAARAGITTTRKSVGQVRSLHGIRTGPMPRRGAMASASATTPLPAAGHGRSPEGDALIALIAEIGTTRAQSIIDECRRRLTGCGV